MKIYTSEENQTGNFKIFSYFLNVLQFFPIIKRFTVSTLPSTTIMRL